MTVTVTGHIMSRTRPHAARPESSEFSEQAVINFRPTPCAQRTIQLSAATDVKSLKPDGHSLHGFPERIGHKS